MDLDEFLVARAVSEPFRNLPLPDGFSQWDELGSAAKSIQRDLTFLLSRSTPPPVSRGASTLEGDSSCLRLDSGSALERYQQNCEQLNMTPNTGAELVLRSSKAADSEHVVIAHLGLRDAGALAFARAFPPNSRLVLLDVSDNGLSSRGVVSLLMFLGHQHALRAIQLSHNVQVGSKSVKPLFIFLSRRRRVTEVGLEGTSIEPEARQALYLQTSRNEHAGNAGALATPAAGLLKPSREQQRVAELARRFGLLEGDGKPQMDAAPGMPGEIEDSWAKVAEFDLAAALHRRWRAEQRQIKETFRKWEEHEAAKMKRRMLRAVAYRWFLLANALLQSQKGLTAAQELVIMLKRDIPVHRAELEAGIIRLRDLIATLEQDPDLGTNSSLLLERARRRLHVLEAGLGRSTSLLRMFKVVVRCQPLLRLRRERWRTQVEEQLKIDFSSFRLPELRELTAVLCRLVEFGKQLMMDGACDEDCELIGAAQERLDHLALLIVSKEKVFQRTASAFRTVRAVNRWKGQMLQEMFRKSMLIEDGIAGLLKRSEGWKDNFSADQVYEMMNDLQPLLDAARLQQSGVNADVLKRAESLHLELEEHLHFIRELEDKLETLDQRVCRVLGTTTFDESGRADDGALKLVMEDIARLESTEFGKQLSSPFHRRESNLHRSTLSRIRKTISNGLHIVEHSADFFALKPGELRGRSANSRNVAFLMPLQNALCRIAEEKRTGASPNLDAVQMVVARLHSYGYNSIGQLVADETTEATQFQLAERMAKLGIFDPSVIAVLFQLIQPFTFANFRRLLASPAVSGDSADV